MSLRASLGNTVKPAHPISSKTNKKKFSLSANLDFKVYKPVEVGLEIDIVLLLRMAPNSCAKGSFCLSLVVVRTTSVPHLLLQRDLKVVFI